MIGCGDVAEVKAGPALQKADGSALVAVMRRDVEKARDFARRHGVSRAYGTAADLIADPEVDVVYIATPPSSHCELALEVAHAGKPCLVEKPMAMTPAECARMVGAFRDAGQPLWVAYYRRALPRTLLVRQLIADGSIGRVTSVHFELFTPLASPERARSWRFDPSVAGGGLFFDMGAHSVDIVDFLVGPMADISAVALNTGGAYPVEDLVAASFRAGGVAGVGLWNFNAGRHSDCLHLTGTAGSVSFSLFNDDEVVLQTAEGERQFESRNPLHVHQPLIQSIVDELRGRGRCESTGENGLRAAEVMAACVAGYVDA
jgi:1,5-anhydro-D-fructose reductase (1,5-anhydro-D-mannitol-forming)